MVHLLLCGSAGLRLSTYGNSIGIYHFDPQGPFVDKGAIYAGENGVYKQANDFTVFEHQGQLYAVWGTLGAGEPIGPAIAPMDNPYTISVDRSFLPGGGGEGPRVLQKDGKVFITMSEGDYASNGYRLSYFMNTDGNILNPSSWSRTNDVFVATNEVSGPARAGFVKSADGTEDWMIYHSRVYKDTGRNWWREVNIKKFDWNPDGTPNFGQPVSPNEWQSLPSGDPGQGDMYQAENAVLYGDITSDNAHTNYQGTGYIHLPTTGAEASFVVQAQEAGDYIVGTRYAYGVQVNGESTNNPTTQLPGRAKINVYVNGIFAKSISPDKTAISWDEWFTDSQRLHLQAGENVISYRIDNRSIGNVNLDYLTMYRADIPNVIDTNQVAGTLSGTTVIQAGQQFEMNYGLTHVSNKAEDAVYAQDLFINYDANKLDLESAVSKKEGLVVLGFKKVAPGQAHILLASLGAGNTVTTDGDLLTLHWKALQVTDNASITISPAKIANSKGVETVLAPVAFNLQVTGGGTPSSPDVNADGKVSIGDLGILAFSYGISSSSPDWAGVQKLDLNHDGVIDIVDLAALARAIIQ